MVRTKAESSGRKAVAAKAPRKALGGGGSSSSAGTSSPAGSNKSSSKYAGGNSACDRPTPEWQKGIANFCMKKPVTTLDERSVTNSNDEIVGGPSTAAECATGSSQSLECSSQSSNEERPHTSRNGIIDSDDDDA